jgi:hypothetical protein
MDFDLSNLATWPWWGLAILAVVAVVQLSLQVTALIDLYKRPADQLTNPNKWIWAALILLLSTLGIGALVYLLAGRKPAAAVEVRPSAPAASRASDAANLLYGEDDDAR